MENSIYKFILEHSKKGQLLLLLLSLLSLPVIYITLELPKEIINLLEGKSVPELFSGMNLSEIDSLLLLSFTFLLMVFINGGLKYFMNVYRGALGERLLRRMRYELYQRILRFPVPLFKKVSQGEMIPMITAETEALAEFFGESFTLPVLQGGMLFTYVLFIFQQDVFLGLAAISLYPFQLYIIPKLQKRVNKLSKKRVLTVRKLSGRIGESISGIVDIHANDTSHFERSNINHHLSSIYKIRFAIYRRKFLIKFLNNFIAQMTPFFFYSIGGYFVLKGSLSIGSLVAVLVAYKDLAAPWKELLRYYQRKEDIKVKYQQIIEQFNPDGMLSQQLLDSSNLSDETESKSITSPLKLDRISYTEDGLNFNVQGINLSIRPGQHLAIVGLSGSGKDELSFLLCRLIKPSSGNLIFNGQNLADMPEKLTGQRISYVGQNTYIFKGSVRDNVLYPLKNRVSQENRSDDDKQQTKDRQLAILSGSTDICLHDQWIDYAARGFENEQQFWEQLHKLLAIVELDEDIYQFGLLSRVDRSNHENLVDKVMQARLRLIDLLSQPDMTKLFEPFDQQLYNTNLSVAENLLFGTIYDDSIKTEKLVEYPFIRQVMDQVQLTGDFLKIGIELAEVMLELFSDVEPESELFEQFSFIQADDLAEFHQLVKRSKNSVSELSEEDKSRLLTLPFKLIVARHRLGLITEPIQQRILQAREIIRQKASAHGLGIEFFDQSKYNPRISIQDNLLFGKLAYGQANAQSKIHHLISNVVHDLVLRKDIIEAGLDFPVGVSGSHLSLIQRQKLGLVRSLVKKPDLLVVNEALSTLNTREKKRIIKKVCDLMRSNIVVWVLSRARLAELFDKTLVMDKGNAAGNESFVKLQESNPVFQQIISDE